VPGLNHKIYAVSLRRRRHLSAASPRSSPNRSGRGWGGAGQNVLLNLAVAKAATIDKKMQLAIEGYATQSLGVDTEGYPIEVGVARIEKNEDGGFSAIWERDMSAVDHEIFVMNSRDDRPVVNPYRQEKDGVSLLKGCFWSTEQDYMFHLSDEEFNAYEGDLEEVEVLNPFSAAIFPCTNKEFRRMMSCRLNEDTRPNGHKYIMPPLFAKGCIFLPKRLEWLVSFFS
jgi:hypothetical protein